MGQIADWWSNRALGGDWQMPISSFQRFRPVGGYLIGTATTIEFVPNRFEALIGGSGWTASLSDIESVTFGRRHVRLVRSENAGGNQTLCTNRPKAVRRNLASLLDRQAVAV
jgi:hypothetical protein